MRLDVLNCLGVLMLNHEICYVSAYVGIYFYDMGRNGKMINFLLLG